MKGLPTLRAQAVSGIAAGSLEGWSENMDSGAAWDTGHHLQNR